MPDEDELMTPGEMTRFREETEGKAARIILPAVGVFLVAVAGRAARVYQSGEPFVPSLISDEWAKAVDSVRGKLSRGNLGISVAAERRFVAELSVSSIPDLAYETTKEILDLAAVQTWSLDDLRQTIDAYLDPHNGGPAVAAIKRSANEVPSLSVGREGEGWEASAMREIRTTTTEVVADRSIDQIRDAGLPGKKWVARHDERTRPSHMGADGQIVPLDSYFTVGGVGMYIPADPEGPPSEVFNCRCIVVATRL